MQFKYFLLTIFSQYISLKVADPAHSAMLKFLFLKACEPYCEFIRSWIFKAELNDPHKEFIMDCASESTSFSWNKPGISPLKKVRVILYSRFWASLILVPLNH